MKRRAPRKNKQPWSPADATDRIREKASYSGLSLCLTAHAKEQLAKRSLLVGDVLQVLRNGFVYDDAEPATQEGFFKYRIEGSTPNSGKRRIRLVVIPYPSSMIKVVTAMWVTKMR